jgi:hypothetical protein
MKTFKVICTAMVLSLVLSVPAYAGDISTPGVASGTPIVPSQPTEPGEINTPGFTSSSADFFQFLLTLVF